MLIGLVCALLVCTPQDDAIVDVEVPIGAILGTGMRRPMLAPHFLDPFGGDHLETESVSPTGPTRDGVSEWLDARCEADIGSRELAIVDSERDDTLLLRGTPAAVQRASRELAFLERAVARPLQLEFAAWRVTNSPENPRTSYAPGEFERLAGLELLSRARCVTRAHEVVIARSQRATTVISDLEVELMGNKAIDYPIVGALLTGLSASVLPIGLGRDAIGMCGEVAFGELISLERITTGVKDQSDVDGPVVPQFVSTFAGRVENGGQLVCWALGSSAEAPVVAVSVRARWLTAAPVAPQGTILLPIAAVGSLQIPSLGAVEDGSAEPRAGSFEGRAVFDLAWDAARDDDVRIVLLGTWLGVLGDAPTLARVEAALGLAVDGAFETNELELEVPVPDGTAAHHVFVPAVSGLPIALRHGTQRRSLKTFGLEVSSSSAGLNPILITDFSGLSATGRVAPGVADLRGEIDLRLGSRVTSRSRDLGGVLGGRIDQLETDVAVRPFLGVIERGMAVELGDGVLVPIRGVAARQPTTLVLTIR